MKVHIIQTDANTYEVPSIDARRRNGRSMYAAVKSRHGCCDGILFHQDGSVTRCRFEPTGWRVEDEQPPCLQGDGWELTRPDPA